MKPKNFKSIVALIVLMVFANVNLAMGQVNMNRWIKLKVTQGQAISLDLRATAANTPIKIVSGSTNNTLSVGTGWTTFSTHYAAADTMVIYGNLNGFDCRNNGDKVKEINAYNAEILTYLSALGNTALTAVHCAYNDISTLYLNGCTALKSLDCDDNELTTLDLAGLSNLEQLWCRGNNLTSLNLSGKSNLYFVSCYANNLTSLNIDGCTALKTLLCHGNSFTTQQLNDLYCSLPMRAASDNAVIKPIYDSGSSNYATVMATNKQNAIDKGWKVQYYSNSTAIPATSGTYACPVTNRVVTLTVRQGETIYFKVKGFYQSTKVRIYTKGTSETYDQTVTVGRTWSSRSVTALGTTVTIFGDITGLDINVSNGNKITKVDAANHGLLETLYCQNNTGLITLWCYGNNISDLYVNGCRALERIDCERNNLSTIVGLRDLSALKTFYCFDNKLTSLDLSGFTSLNAVYASDNKLTSLNISGCTSLKTIHCNGNNLTTQTLDDIFCALPQRSASDGAVIAPMFNASSSNYSTVMATNKNNATAKNWKVRYSSNNTDIPATNGLYMCAGATCPKVTNLRATVNANKTVTLTWTNPAQNTWPTACSGDLDFKFYNGTTLLKTEYTDNLTTWTTASALPGGSHTLSVEILYYRNGGNPICISDKATVTVSVPTAVDLAESAFSIYPNPAQDEVTISIEDLTSDAKATILDMQGRVMGEYTLSATTGKATVDVSALTDGVYMVRIVSKDINRVERLIIKR